MIQSETPITDEKQLQCESLSDLEWGFEGWTLAKQHEIKITLLENTLLNDHDAARTEGLELNEALIAITKQRDKLAEAVNAATILIAAKGRHNTMLAYEGLRKALQSLTPIEL